MKFFVGLINVLSTIWVVKWKILLSVLVIWIADFLLNFGK